jgi:hypothetical protein
LPKVSSIKYLDNNINLNAINAQLIGEVSQRAQLILQTQIADNHNRYLYEVPQRVFIIKEEIITPKTMANEYRIYNNAFSPSGPDSLYFPIPDSPPGSPLDTVEINKSLERYLRTLREEPLKPQKR